jgi:hypothetical protein
MWRTHFCVPRRDSEFLKSPRRFSGAEENRLTQLTGTGAGSQVGQTIGFRRLSGAGDVSRPDRRRKTIVCPVCPTSGSPKLAQLKFHFHDFRSSETHLDARCHAAQRRVETRRGTQKCVRHGDSSMPSVHSE